MKEYKNHKLVAKKYKWDLSFLLEGKTPKEAMEEIIKLCKISIKIKDTKYKSSQTYLNSLKDEEKLQIKVNKLENYIFNFRNLDVTNKDAKTLIQKFEFEMYKLANELGPEATRFFKHAKDLAKWAKLPEFKEYKYIIEHQLQEKKFLLPKVIEEYKIKVSRGKPDYEDIFATITDSEIDYGYATKINGKKTKITKANILKLKMNNDKMIRKTAAINYRDAYLKHKNSLASLLYQHKKNESALLMARGHKSAVEGLIFNDRVDTKFLEVLFKVIQDNAKIFVPYKNAYKKNYKLKFKENITRYDWERPLVKINQNIKIEEAIKDVQIAFKPFGKEYNEIINKAFKENWVDFMAIKNKLSGAYSIGSTYGISKKLILMNFTGDLGAVETLAHELGHSMHSYYSDKIQKTAGNASYPIFLAEIASIFNELMINDHLLKTLKDKKTKWYILNNVIDGFLATVYRQTEWANYEYDLYNQIDQGQPVGSYETMAKIYYDNSIKYAIKKPKKYDPKKQFKAIYVPHFYYGFYVYKYAIGQLVANIFFAKYKQEGKKALQFYIDKFLSAGGSKDPLDILKDVGIDLKDPKTYEIGFKQIKTTIKEHIKLGNEIFK